MVSILLTDTTPAKEQLMKALQMKKNDVAMSDYPDAIQLYKDHHPSITIMNFKDSNSAADATQKIINFDDSACVLALVDPRDTTSRDEAIKAGAKAVINTTYIEDDVDKVVEDIYRVCCTIRDEKCMGCVLGHHAN